VLHPATPEIQSRLRSVTAEVSLFLGWLAILMPPDNSTARGYYHEALRSAREGADADLPRYVLGHIAWLAQAEGKVAEALSVVDSEIDPAPPAPALWTRSWFAAVEANCTARSPGRPELARLALERSHQWFHQGLAGRPAAMAADVRPGRSSWRSRSLLRAHRGAHAWLGIPGSWP